MSPQVPKVGGSKKIFFARPPTLKIVAPTLVEATVGSSALSGIKEQQNCAQSGLNSELSCCVPLHSIVLLLARLSWPRSVFQSTLNSCIVLYLASCVYWGFAGGIVSPVYLRHAFLDRLQPHLLWKYVSMLLRKFSVQWRHRSAPRLSCLCRRLKLPRVLPRKTVFRHNTFQSSIYHSEKLQEK